MRARKAARRGLALSALIAVGYTLIAIAPAFAGETITASATCCTFTAPKYFAGVGEPVLFSDPANADTSHNVTAAEKGADGSPLFSSATIGPGRTTPVNGTQYLPPGEYRFVCSIHEHPTLAGTRMEAILVITDDGQAPLARPTLSVKLPPQPLARLRRRGRLSVEVEAASAAQNVVLVAKRNGRKIAGKSGVSVQAGVPETVVLTLTPAARKALRTVKSAVVSVTATVEFGIPGTAHRRLR